MKLIKQGGHLCDLHSFNNRSTRYKNGAIVQCGCGIYYQISMSPGWEDFLSWHKLSKRQVRKLGLQDE